MAWRGETLDRIISTALAALGAHPHTFQSSRRFPAQRKNYQAPSDVAAIAAEDKAKISFFGIFDGFPIFATEDEVRRV